MNVRRCKSPIRLDFKTLQSLSPPGLNHTEFAGEGGSVHERTSNRPVLITPITFECMAASPSCDLDSVALAHETFLEIRSITDEDVTSRSETLRG